MIHPSHAFYRPGETVEISVPGSFKATIWHLADVVARIEDQTMLRWLPPAIPRRGYRIRITNKTGDYWTAFDVLSTWTDAPRYGFLFDFSPERLSVDLDWLLAHHVNGIQFYDWLYRHDWLMPPQSVYDDPLGRHLSLDTVRQLISAAHSRGMAALPYTAIYAASPSFAAEHSDWGLYDSSGTLHDFADGFLKIMNLDSPWRTHFLHECESVLNALSFDGLHIDQYGEPQTGFDATGETVDLPQAIAETLHAIHNSLSENKVLLFNLVHNWPLETIASTPVDFLYCELWPPQITLGDLARITTQNWQVSGGHCPVVAVYINPAYERTVTLVQSVIAASGGYHIAHGEDGLYLSDPYFPKAERPSKALAKQLKRLADFGVAYSELLTFACPVDVKAQMDESLWLIPRRAPGKLILNLINASPQDRWDRDLAPALSSHVRISIPVENTIEQVWIVSPDEPSPPQQLDFSQGNNLLNFEVPEVNIWTLVCIQFTPTVESEQ